MRNGGPDYLAYALIDAIVDSYFHCLNRLEMKLKNLKTELLLIRSKTIFNQSIILRRELILLRKSVWPLRELLSNLQRNENGIVKPQTQVYIRDVYDHTIQIIDTIESYRDMVMGMLGNISFQSKQQNERSDESVNRHRNHFYSSYIFGWCVRNELQTFSGVAN